MKPWPNSRAFSYLLLVLVAIIAPPALAGGIPMFVGETTTIANMDEAMKIYFTDPVFENFVEDTEMMEEFQEDNNVQIEISTGGRYIETAQYFRLPAGTRSITAGDHLPVPSAPRIRNSRVYLKKHAGVIDMQGDVMERVRSDMGAYLDYMDRALPDLLLTFNDMIDRQLLGYGNGAICQIAGINGTTISLENAFGVSGWGPCWTMFQEGYYIVASADADGDPIRSAGAGQSRVVDDLDDINDAIELSAAPPVTWAPGDFLFMGDDAGVATQTALGDDREMMGVAGMIDDGGILGEFQNLDRATYRPWRSIVVDGSVAPFNGTLDEDIIVHADNQAFQRGKGKPQKLITSRYQTDNYWRSLKTDRTLVDPKAYEGGKGPLFVRLGDRLIPLKVCRKMPEQIAYLMDNRNGAFRRWQIDGGKWDDRTGAIWNRSTDAVGRLDDFYAVYLWYAQTGAVHPRRSVRIEGLS